MKKPITMMLALAAVAATACGEGNGVQTITATEAKSALATTSDTSVGTATDSADAASTTTTHAAFDPTFHSSSEYANITYASAWTVNLSIGWVLSVVNGLTAYEPTSCSGDTCTWGPIDLRFGPKNLVLASWKLSVTKTSDTDYSYAMSARNVANGTDWLDVLSGTTSEPSYGSRKGALTANFDNVRTLLGADAPVYGVLTEKYSNIGDATLDATFIGAHDVETGEVFDGVYRFVNRSSGGDLQVAIASQTTAKHVSLHSRWDSSGEGRGDGRLVAGDGTTTVTSASSQCWDARFDETYDSATGYGSVSACASAFQGDPQYSDLTVR